jgi:AcrR family transcriptional regulator
MGAKAGYSQADVIAEAVRQVDAHGWHQLSMGALAARLKIKTPSLYNHVDGVNGLRRMLALRAAALLDDALAQATVGKSGDAAVLAMAQAHRAFLKAHPGLAEATAAAPPKKDRVWIEAADRIVNTCLLVLQGYGLGAEDALHALRGIRSAVHGFATLERHGGFGLPLDVDKSFEWMVRALIDGIGAIKSAKARRTTRD